MRTGSVRHNARLASSATDLERAVDFLRRADEGASTAVRGFEHGIALFHDGLPRVWDRNFLLVTKEPGAAGGALLERTADELQGGAGLTHRKVIFQDEGVGERHSPALGERGWELRRLAIMVYRGGAPARAAAEASEVDREALDPATRELIRSEPWGGDAETVRQLAGADLPLAQALGERCFAFVTEGRVVSMCRLYSDGRIAQVEDVSTLPAHRSRGHARAVVARAALEAAATHELVILTAIDGHWVRDWYARLGFEEVGRRWEATKPG